MAFGLREFAAAFVAMFAKIQLQLSADRSYCAYVSGDQVEIIATIDGHPARFGSARWNGSELCECTSRLRHDVLLQLGAAIRDHEKH